MIKEEFLQQLPEFVNNYQPSAEVLRHISDVSLLMVIGPSGVGKTSLINQLNLQNVLGDTTREPRPEEKDGVDYCFRKDYENIINELKNGLFVQVAIGSGGDFYATRNSSFPEFGTGVMAVVADVIPIFRKLGFKKTISVFVAPPSYDEWMRRLSDHELSDEQLTKRLAEAKRSFEFALSDKNTYFVLNDNLEKAAAQTLRIINGEVDEHEEQSALKIAEKILDAIK
jgi:guanylate kinase